MCCQESGEREASVSLFCPRAKPGEKKFRKVRFYLFRIAVDDQFDNRVLRPRDSR